MDWYSPVQFLLLLLQYIYIYIFFFFFFFFFIVSFVMCFLQDVEEEDQVVEYVSPA